MYRIVGQLINFRYIGTNKVVKKELSDKAKQIIN